MAFGILSSQQKSLSFFGDRVLQVRPQTVEFRAVLLKIGGVRRPDHVANAQADHVEIALSAQQTKRVMPVAIDGIGLETAQSLQLMESVGGITGYGRQGDQQT